jgi:hypothetical protein
MQIFYGIRDNYLDSYLDNYSDSIRDNQTRPGAIKKPTDLSAGFNTATCTL